MAAKYKQTAIASTEHGKPMGWITKKMYCDKVGIKFMHGVEIYLTETLDEKVRDNYHTILIAKNMNGLMELNDLVSMSSDDRHSYYTNRISFDEFLGISDNIISTSACLGSPLNKLDDTHPRYIELANKYTYLEIQPHLHKDQIAYNQRLSKLSKTIGTPLIAASDTHSSTQYKAECRSVLLSSKGKVFSDEDSFDLTYKGYEEMVSMFRRQNALEESEYLEALENTNIMADSVEEFQLDAEIKYPILYGTRESDSDKFTRVVWEKFEDKLRKGIIPQYQENAFKEALLEELRVFKKLSMDGFMLSMSELISWCKEKGLSIGPGRGSVTGSRVAYVTDVTDVNPETWNTIFSRFCNEDRLEVGDIDIDCIDSDRPAIFEYIKGRFGTDKTARVASFGTMQARKVIDDVARHLAKEWERNNNIGTNPWSLSNTDKIKSLYDSDSELAREKYKELFYYFDGLLNTKCSQSVHPAGMVISPITLNDNYGTFNKDGEICLMLDMDEAHEVGLTKYDFLVLKTVQVIKNTCDYIHESYPVAHEVNWNDENVWNDMIKNPTGLFQFESAFTFSCLKKFAPKSIFDMSLVTAAIRPSAASYRDDLLSRKQHKNPSSIIDDLLSDNLGYLVYQEDTLKFLNQVCGLSGSEADNIRRGIGRKQKDRLEAAMPSILEGYCSKSDKDRSEAENEVKEFLQIIEDSANYQFGYNHAVAYCLLGYLCAYYRYYHPVEFLTSFLNNAANDEDIQNGTNYATKIGVKVSMPKWGISKGEYFYDLEKRIIAKGLYSVKHIGKSVADELYQLSQHETFSSFIELLTGLDQKTSLDTRQLEILIKIDFFSDFGNQRELLNISELFHKMFKKGFVKQINKLSVSGTAIEQIVAKYSIGTTKAGLSAKSYTVVDTASMMREAENQILGLSLDDFSDIEKVDHFVEAMGYMGYMSGKNEDRRKLYIVDIYELKRKKDQKQFGYSIITKSIGSGIDSRFTVFNKVYNGEPIHKKDIIYCTGFTRDGQYFTLDSYKILHSAG